MPAPPSYQKANPGDQSVILLILRSPTLPLSVVDEYAQQTIAQRISMVNGVAQVDVFGSQKYAVRIDADPRKLAAYSIGIDEVAGAVLFGFINDAHAAFENLADDFVAELTFDGEERHWEGMV